MSKKNLILLGVIMILILIGGSFFAWKYFTGADDRNLLLIKKDKPELVEYVDKVLKWEKELDKDPTRTETYLTLGLAWKSLADRTRADDHYRRALELYEEGAELSGRKNTVFLMNAGNMATYLRNYTLAEKYYREAITQAPGDLEYYNRLVELYEFNLDNPKDKILSLFDEAGKRVINTAAVEQARKSYLSRQGEIK